MSIYDNDKFLNYLSGANRSAYNLGDLGELGINTDLFNFNLDLPQLNQGNMLSTVDLINDPELFKAFATLYPEDAALLLPSEGGKEYVSQNPSGLTEPPSNVYDPNDQSAAETKRLERQANATPEGDETGIKSGVPVGDPNDPTGIKKLNEISGNTSKNLLQRLLGGNLKGSDLAKGLAAAFLAKKAYDEGQEARNYRRGAKAQSGTARTVTRKGSAAGGGIGSLEMARGGSTLPARYLDGHSDGMADRVPAQIDNRRPAALSDGEFVIPADVVSHLGNGNSNAGAKRLYKMMDDIRAARTGNPKQGKQINPDKFMPR